MKKKRKILLLEPNYKNKYPPIGLMKIATYYRLLGDDVHFYKGELNNFVIQELTEDTIVKLSQVDKTVEWRHFYFDIKNYIRYGHDGDLKNIIQHSNNHAKLIELSCKYFRKAYTQKEYFKNPRWDRVHVTTLFTFYWKQTIETVEFAKKIVKNIKNVKAGGVLASVVSKEFEKATGVVPDIGLLNKPGIYDDNDYIIDKLPLDYSILEEIDYKYPESDSYYGYMSRGCVNKCKFCAVPIIEPKYENMITINDKIAIIRKNFGEQKNLLLLDNNVLASEKFNEIIKEIKEAGFYKGAKFERSNYLDIAIARIKENYNKKAYIRKATNLFLELLDRLHGEEKQTLFDALKEHYLLNEYTATEKDVLEVYSKFKDVYECRRLKSKMNRYIDFNQGLDARLMTDEKMKLLSEIAINPLRIAFDNWNLKDTYIKAIKLAAKHNIKHLSNYILYNFEDKPIELYYRLKINVELSDDLGVRIYSFPMKYHPIMDPKYFQNREYIGTHWNRKFIRAIQAVLNSTKGKIGTGKSFFDEAFGKNEEEFYKILHMPEAFIIYRMKFKNSGWTDRWWKDYNNLSKKEKDIANSIIYSNKFNDIEKYKNHKKIYQILQYYTINKEIPMTTLLCL
jgi:hypothetical protein